MKQPHVLLPYLLADPLDKKTWSGTTSNIARALEAEGARVSGYVPHSASRAKIENFVRMINRRVKFAHIDLSRSKSQIDACYNSIAAHAESLGDVDIVLHFTTLMLPLSAKQKAKIRAKQAVYLDCTWNLAHAHQGYLDASHPKVAKIDALEGAGIRQMDRVLPIGEYLRENIVNHYGVDPRKVVAVGTGRGEAIAPFEGQKDFANGHVLFVAKHFFERKGGELMLKAFEMLERTHPHIRLKLIGQPEVLDRVKDRPNIEAHGFVPLEQLQAMFDEAALFAMPALYEPWGLVFIEAMTTQTPVLGLNQFSVPEFVRGGKHGFVVPEPTAECLAHTIAEAMSDPIRLVRMGADAKKFALETYSWQRVAREILQT